jgi:aminopeptidase
MTDPRFTKLAHLLSSYSMGLQPGDNVLIDLMDTPDEMGVELIRAARSMGAIPLLDIRHSRLVREIQIQTSPEHAQLLCEVELEKMQKVQAYVAIRGSYNFSEGSDVPSSKQILYSKALRPVLDYRVNKTRWVVLRWPTPSMAQAAAMSTEAFEDFYFEVCTMDYEKMSKAMDPLVELMNQTDKVRIAGPDTDISFSIAGINAIKCSGLRNIPDGEVYTAPVKNSVNGKISYNAPTLYSGTRFEKISLQVAEGKIVEASSTGGSSDRLNHILNTDAGARYFGEFALGLNPYILNPMCDILFDEKISGSLHFTPGAAYAEADNGNRSAVHWDMVLVQRPEWGGGEIWFDGQLVRKDGLFVHPALLGLNPENLK